MEDILNVTPFGFELAMQEAIELPSTMNISQLNEGGIITSSSKTPKYALLIISIIAGGIISYFTINIYKKNKRTFVVKNNKDLEH